MTMISFADEGGKFEEKLKSQGQYLKEDCSTILKRKICSTRRLVGER